MRGMWTWTAFALVACAKQVPVEIAMAPSGVELTPRWVELEHEDKGWVRVDLDGTPSEGRGPEVVIGAAEIPKGRYDAVRFAYTLQGAPDLGPGRADPDVEVGVRPGTEPASRGQGEEQEALIQKAFCVRDQDDELVLEVLPVHPARGSQPKVDLRAPGC